MSRRWPKRGVYGDVENSINGQHNFALGNGSYIGMRICSESQGIVLSMSLLDDSNA